MESSEDDAGAATIVSRRASAREKDGQSKDIGEGTSHEGVPEPEDKTRGPSPHDANSTDAILDMIDQLVEGPGPTIRCSASLKSFANLRQQLSKPLIIQSVKTSEQALVSDKLDRLMLDGDISASMTNTKSELQASISTFGDSLPGSPLMSECSPAASESAMLEGCILSEELNEIGNTSASEIGINNPTSSQITQKEPVEQCSTKSIPAPEISSKSSYMKVKVTESANVTESSAAKEIFLVSDSGIVTESPVVTPIVSASRSSVTESVLDKKQVYKASSSLQNCDDSKPVEVVQSSNLPSSSEAETLQDIEKESERTKCVSSSVNKDVSVVEATCSERPRRRLIRPAPSERRSSPSLQPSGSDSIERNASPSERIELLTSEIQPLSSHLQPSYSDRGPDTTVSSTVDSLTSNKPTATDSKKLVSSSSDAVTTSSIYDRVKSSEVSICKAETSLSPKRIKLIRNKITTSVNQKDNTDTSEVKVTPMISYPVVSQDISAVPSTSTNCAYSISQPTGNTSAVESKQDNVNKKCDNQNTESDNYKENITLSREESPKSSESISNAAEIPVEISKEVENDIDHKRVEPLKLCLSVSSPSRSSISPKILKKDEVQDSKLNIKSVREESPVKQIPKLTIKLRTEECKSPIPKLTIKPIKPPINDYENDTAAKQIPLVTKLNIKPIVKPTEKSNQIQKSSSSEISESESSENDESASTSDQTSASDQGAMDTVPKVTIKLGKPGTESEGQFYTQKKSIPKLTIKNLQNDVPADDSNYTVLCHSVSEYEKIPKLTIKPISKPEGQPLSPKLIIKPIKPPEDATLMEKIEIKVDNPPIPKLKISQGSLSPSMELRKSSLVSKISMVKCDVPIVTKLNIKPIVKPLETLQDCESSQSNDEKNSLISKIFMKSIKPKETQNDYNKVEIPVVSKLNIKPIKIPDDEPCIANDNKKSIDTTVNIPVVTKLNIKPIVEPVENDSKSETENSSDEYSDIPVVTKINIKPIVKPADSDAPIERIDIVNTITKINMKPLLKYSERPSSPKKEAIKKSDHNSSNPETLVGSKLSNIITKLNIRPVVAPSENTPSSPKKDIHAATNSDIPIVTKLNIKPIVKPDAVNEIDKDKECNDNVDSKKSSLVMKINLKTMTDAVINDSMHNAISASLNKPHNDCNNLKEHTSVMKANIKPVISPVPKTTEVKEKVQEMPKIIKENCETDSLSGTVSEKIDNKLNAEKPVIQSTFSSRDKSPVVMTNHDSKSDESQAKTNKSLSNSIESNTPQLDKTNADKHDNVKSGVDLKSKIEAKNFELRQNCTLLKKLLEVTRSDNDLIKIDNNSSKLIEKCISSSIAETATSSENISYSKADNKDNSDLKLVYSFPNTSTDTPSQTQADVKCNKRYIDKLSNQFVEEHCNKTDVDIAKKCIENAVTDENLKMPLEIVTSEKPSQSTETTIGQECPQIILNINKTDHGTLVKDITEEVVDTSAESPNLNTSHEKDKASEKLVTKVVTKNPNRRKQSFENINTTAGKRLRSFKASEDLIPVPKKILIKKTSPEVRKPEIDKELSVMDAKRLKLEDLLSNTSITLTKIAKTSPETNHVKSHNENSPKNGSANIRSIFGIAATSDNANSSFDDASLGIKTIYHESESASISSDVVEIVHPDVQEMLMSETSSLQAEYLDDLSQDPLDVDLSKSTIDSKTNSPEKEVGLVTPQPRKRGRPRKIPIPESTKPILPVPALEERPQRSLRLTRERPSLTITPRTRRGRPTRGLRISCESDAPEDSSFDKEDLDPTSSRIKLPRLTEAFNKCATPLSSRLERHSLEDGKELKVVLEEIMVKSPTGMENNRGRGRGGRGRGSRGGRVSTPTRNRGRGRGGGRGAKYMKETMGIYGRVCGPSTTTVPEMFEEETCMMDDNATPAKNAHLLDEDSQSSVKSSTNESSKFKKSKFADVFDSNKVWTAADVKEYTWTDNGSTQIMMIQEQVAMFLEVKSFKRKYPELKRRPIAADERQYILSKGIVTEALCDLGITAVEAGEVLDIMLSDFPHKYEEYRSHQRQRQPDDVMDVDEVKSEEKIEKIEMKVEVKSDKPEPPPEKSRQDMAAAAIASASEWNARLNAIRRPACVDMQSMVVHQRRGPAPSPGSHVVPPSGFYPHALLPGQYQHSYRTFTSEQLNCYPMNTVLSAPPRPPSPSETSSHSDADWGFGATSSDESDNERSCGAKRRKLMKNRLSRPAEVVEVLEPVEAPVATCRTCGLREEANRKVAQERFLVCGNCQAALHPSCTELGGDTVRKCRDYAWQCAECKTCGECSQTRDEDKMLFCDLCDRGFHYYCVGLSKVPTGRWHCVDCAVCKSCGARTSGPETDAEWHHHSKRGPGGHKVYSHTLCTPCQRAYRIGRYCPLCERSFIGPKGTMQLVICKLCDRQLHQECVRSTVSQLNIMDYTCAECRRSGITSRSAAVRLAPRTIATLFMAKRRFNKYAHRQYVKNRNKAKEEAELEEQDYDD